VNRNALTAIAVLAALGLAGLAGWYLASAGMNPAMPAEPVTVAYSPFESTALFWIAEDQGFFEKNGLNITLKNYDSGVASLDGVVNGEADLCVGVSEFPLVRKAFANTPVHAWGNIDKGNFVYLVARKDRVENESDLRGKRIGTATGSIAEFYLGRYLSLHGLSIQDVQYVSVKTPPETADAVVNGSLDAAVLGQPYANAARDHLGDNAVVWSAQSNQSLYALVVSMDTWIERNPRAARNFLLSLSQAEEYGHAHPAEAKAILQKRLGLDAGYVETVWNQNQFSLSLDQSLILAMEDETRWMIANNLTNATAVPDFRKFIYTDGLESVRPGSVNII
jgi:NitT/TauT family transport system substrate-binding protein